MEIIIYEFFLSKREKEIISFASMKKVLPWKKCKQKVPEKKSVSQNIQNIFLCLK